MQGDFDGTDPTFGGGGFGGGSYGVGAGPYASFAGGAGQFSDMNMMGGDALGSFGTPGLGAPMGGFGAPGLMGMTMGMAGA